MNRTYMKTGLVAVLVMVLIISPVYAQSGNLVAAGDINITIAGSTTVLPIAEACASAYTTNNPGSQIDVSGGGSSYGIAAVANGTVDIGTASRDLKPAEIAAHPYLETHSIAKDGVAIVVNPSNSVAGLTMGQLQDIYTGDITNWQQVGGTDSPIVVVSREEGSGTRDCFEQAVLKPIGGVLVGTAVIQNSNGEMRTEVAIDENAIGYISLGYVDSSVSAVGLDGVEPTIENIKSGDYEISRTLLMITNGAPDYDAELFLDFVFSEDGQQIVEDEGFIPVGAVYTISLVEGWNLISIPVLPEDASVDAVFGSNIITPVYEYNSGYIAATSLEPKNGYWVLANAQVDIDVTGTAPTNTEVTVPQGWNLIGPVSSGVEVSSFDNVILPVYGYDSGYTSADTLEQTKGYWVLASAETTLTV